MNELRGVPHHSETGQPVPALNVKWMWNHNRALERHRSEFPQTFIDWVENFDSNLMSDTLWAADMAARDFGFGSATTLAQMIFGNNVEISLQGRSGGWLAVRGLPDIEDWEANDFVRWHEFDFQVRDILAELEYEALRFLCDIHKYWIEQLI